MPCGGVIADVSGRRNGVRVVVFVDGGIHFVVSIGSVFGFEIDNQSVGGGPGDKVFRNLEADVDIVILQGRLAGGEFIVVEVVQRASSSGFPVGSKGADVVGTVGRNYRSWIFRRNCC